MSRCPLVGVTTYHREGSTRPAFSLPAAYVDALRLVGALAVLLPPGEEQPEDLLERLDGVVFGGGGDLDPELFEGERHPANYSICRERDAFELALMRAVLEREVPTLAICRGLQVLNVARGGSLLAHLPDARGDQVLHRTEDRHHTYHHVRLEPDSHLARVYAREELQVASWHHQAVERLGDGLRATAWAEDGTVEALDYRGVDWLFAVQWHPELQLEEDSLQRYLFRAFVERAAARKEER